MLESPRAFFWGWVDLDKRNENVDGPVPSSNTSPGGREFSAPGLRCQVLRAGLRVVEFDGGIALASGRPCVAHGVAIASDRQIAEGMRVAFDDEPREIFSGRFSLVYLDLRERRVAMLTDRFGTHPLCYSTEGERLAFADRADAVPTRHAATIDPQAFFNYAYFHVLPAPRTAFENVVRMSPAQRLRFSRRGVDSSTTWKPKFRSAGDAGASPSPAEFLMLVRAAVEREAEERPVGAYLSGGTDSSTVAGMLKAVTGEAPEVFSIGFEAEGYDEIEYARIAVRHFGCRHHVHYVTPDEVIAAVPAIAAQYDQPFGNSSALPAFYCARMAQEAGVRKILAGDGGDELFGGNTRYAKQKIFELYTAVLPGVLRRTVVEPIVLAGPLRAIPGLKKVASYVAQASIPMPDRVQSYNLLYRHGIDRLFTPALVDAVIVSEPEELERSVYAESAGAALVDRMLAYDWRFTLADNDLPKVIGTSRLAEIQVGFPLLDDTLVDFSLLLTPSEKVRGLTLRHWFKQALTDFLPEEIIRKKKHGFGLPFGPWVVKYPKLQQFARDSIEGLTGRGLIQSDAIDRLFSAELERYPGYYGEMIWILMMAEQWLRRAAPSWRLS